MPDQEGTTQNQEGGGDTSTSGNAVGLTAEQAKELFKSELENAQRHFQGVAQKQVNQFRAEANEAKQRAANAEAQLNAMQKQYFDAMDADQKIAYLAQELHTARSGRTDVPTTPQYQGPAYKEVLEEQLRAQGIDPNDPRLDWAPDEVDVTAAAKRVGASVAKIKSLDLDKAVESKITQIKADLKKLVESEYEVGDKSHVEKGGTRSGATGKRYTREDINRMSPEEYKKALSEGAFG
jgi:chromosome segregation ATPase